MRAAQLTCTCSAYACSSRQSVQRALTLLCERARCASHLARSSHVSPARAHAHACMRSSCMRAHHSRHHACESCARASSVRHISVSSARAAPSCRSSLALVRRAARRVCALARVVARYHTRARRRALSCVSRARAYNRACSARAYALATLRSRAARALARTRCARRTAPPPLRADGHLYTALSDVRSTAMRMSV